MLAELDDLGGVHVVADGQLTGGDHALGLETDVEENLVPVDLDDRALDHVSIVELDDGVAHRLLEIGVRQVVVDDRSRVVVPLGIEGAHLLGRKKGGAYVCHVVMLLAGLHSATAGPRPGSGLDGYVAHCRCQRACDRTRSAKPSVLRIGSLQAAGRGRRAPAPALSPWPPPSSVPSPPRPSGGP